MSFRWQDLFKERFQKDNLFSQQNVDELRIADDFASVAFVLVDGKDGPGLLVIKRQHNPDDPWSGHMALPGGRTHLNESAVETARRETFEEIGLELPKSNFLMGPVQARAKQSMASFLIYPCIFVTDYSWADLSLKLCPIEVESAHFFSLSELLDPKNQSHIHWHVGGREVDLPALQVGRHTIWGLTYWMLERFFKQLNGLDLGAQGSVSLKEWRPHPNI